MAYVILPNLRVVLFFICCITESFTKIFIRYLTMSSIVVYHITIIPNILDKVANCMELRVVKD